MKKSIIGAMCFIFLLSASLMSEEHHYFQEFPKYASTNLVDFCDQGIRFSNYQLCIPSTDYIQGYWQGQHDAYSYMQELLLD